MIIPDFINTDIAFRVFYFEKIEPKLKCKQRHLVNVNIFQFRLDFMTANNLSIPWIHYTSIAVGIDYILIGAPVLGANKSGK